MPKIIKTDLVDAIRENSNLDRKDIHHVVDSLLDEIKKALLGGNTVELRGFGTFEVRTRKGRSAAKNPRTGEIVSVPDHSIVYFRSGRELKQSVWTLTGPASEAQHNET